MGQTTVRPSFLPVVDSVRGPGGGGGLQSECALTDGGSLPHRRVRAQRKQALVRLAGQPALDGGWVRVDTARGRPATSRSGRLRRPPPVTRRPPAPSGGDVRRDCHRTTRPAAPPPSPPARDCGAPHPHGRQASKRRRKKSPRPGQSARSARTQPRRVRSHPPPPLLLATIWFHHPSLPPSTGPIRPHTGLLPISSLTDTTHTTQRNHTPPPPWQSQI